MGNKFLTYDSGAALVDVIKSQYTTFDYVDEKIATNISCTTDSLQLSIDALQARVSQLEADIRSVMDAPPEKPKQKYLWEIFEPNDSLIDFSCII